MFFATWPTGWALGRNFRKAAAQQIGSAILSPSPTSPTPKPSAAPVFIGRQTRSAQAWMILLLTLCVTHWIRHPVK
jgi:hypothetical protein